MITLTSGSNTSTTQPATLNETPLPIQTDVTAIDGSQQRNKMSTKYAATLSYGDIQPSDYRTLMLVVNNGSTVTYNNDNSAETGGTLNFVALATISSVGDYEPGSSLWRNVVITLRQV